MRLHQLHRSAHAERCFFYQDGIQGTDERDIPISMLYTDQVLSKYQFGVGRHMTSSLLCIHEMTAL
jgi:hypothetical protein